MSEWQPIETAPKGAAVLLAYKFGLGSAIGHKDEAGMWHGHEGSDWRDGLARFSHWMPLPDPPAD